MRFGQGLMVTAVHERGVVASWNEVHPMRSVEDCRNSHALYSCNGFSAWHVNGPALDHKIPQLHTITTCIDIVLLILASVVKCSLTPCHRVALSFLYSGALHRTAQSCALSWMLGPQRKFKHVQTQSCSSMQQSLQERDLIVEINGAAEYLNMIHHLRCSPVLVMKIHRQETCQHQLVACNGFHVILVLSISELFCVKLSQTQSTERSRWSSALNFFCSFQIC